MYLMQSVLVQSLLCSNLPEGAFYMLVTLTQPSQNVFLIVNKRVVVIVGSRGQTSSWKAV